MKREFEQAEITGLVERHGADVTVLQWRGRLLEQNDEWAVQRSAT